MKFLSLVFLIVVFIISAGKFQTPENAESKLLEYPLPFYVWNDSLESKFFYGIEAGKFIYVRNFKGAWLLYDKRIETEQLINLVGLDEYIFIQSDLERQLKDLLKIRTFNRKFINIRSSPWEK